MKFQTVTVVGIILLSGMAAWAQEFPRVDIGGNYSYARYAPSAPYSQGHSLNGGGGELNVNINEFLGIKMDLQGYGSTSTGFNIAPNLTFPTGLQGHAEGNLFTYLFGPQIKVRAHHLQPYGQLLFGGAHTNVYGNAFQTICQPIVGGCTLSKAPSAEAFAMDFGGGVDIPVGKHVAIRPVQFDYLLTRFSNPFTGSNNQNNFRYSAGVLFSFGHTTY
ncbi:MAG: outer membrane beta-barrel protein [Candidatus Sulfotelmatobacter sp.]